MRAAARLIAIVLGGVLAGCSPILGIEDPVARGDAGSIDTPTPIDGSVDGVTNIDAAIDGPPAVDHLVFNVTDFRLAKQQLVRFHVQLVRAAGGMQDVTSMATYSTDQPTLISFGTKGTLSSSATSGRAAITASFAGATSATVNATVSSFSCHPVINEFQTGTVTSADDEFIEIYNPCTTMINVQDWTLNYRAANAIGGMDTHELILLAGMMTPGELRVYGGSAYTGTSLDTWPSGFGMAQRDGAIGLRSGPTDTGPLVDSVGYGAAMVGNPFIEVKAMATMANGMSGSRLPFDGRDDDPAGAADGDNSADFAVVATLTPGALNTP